MRAALRQVTLSLAAVALAVFGAAAAAAADPLVVTSGGYGFDTGDPASFGVSGDGFALGWAGWQGPTFTTLDLGQLCFSPCTVGATAVDFSSSLLGMSVDTRFFVSKIGGVTYDRLTLTGDMVFTSTPFTFPVTSEPRLQLTSPFTFSGHFAAVDPSDGATVFDGDLVGAGTARLLVFPTCTAPDCSTRATGQYSFVAADYTFENPSPTPEPPTIFLLGAAGLAAAWRATPARNRRPHARR